MKTVRMFAPSISFMFMGIFLLIITIPYIIKTNIGGILENVVWFLCGAVSFCILMQIGMRFAKECLCDVNVLEDDHE